MHFEGSERSHTVNHFEGCSAMKTKLLLAAPIVAFSLASAPAHAAVRLPCLGGLVVARALVKNNTRVTIPAGKTITYRVYPQGLPGFSHNSYTLQSALLPGEYVEMPKWVPWKFKCSASANV